jgi:Pao retrotransposon peptidase
MLSQLAHLFDPMGLVTPCLISSRKYSDICRHNQEWDPPIKERDIEEWAECVQDMKKCKDNIFKSHISTKVNKI